MYEMSKMTLEQEEVRNQEYNEYVEQMTPKHNLWANMGKAFLLGGGICLLGQIILQIAAGVFGLKAEDAALWCSLLLVLLSVILTSCNVYGILANWGGAGALVPITGFANGVCASAVEFQKEGQVFNKLVEAYDKENKKNLTDEEVLEAAAAENQDKKHHIKSKSGIVVRGIHDVAVRFSKCCNPIPGDEIVGYVTRGRGVTIHRTDCVNVMNMSEMDRSRLLEAEWQDPEIKPDEHYMAEINVYANNRTGLLVDISKIFTERKIDIRNINCRTNKQEKATISVSFNVSCKDELNSLIEKIRQLESVLDVERTTG